MKNISAAFSELYSPIKAILIYKGENLRESESVRSENEIYVESYDIGKNGKPINPHPLSGREIAEMSTLFENAKELSRDYLKSEGLMPSKVLHIDPKGSGTVVWYTTSQPRKLYFRKELGIPCGSSKVPPMLWKANREGITVFALVDNKRPALKTPLYHAPFFNIYDNGSVCMGTVRVNIENDSCLETFMDQWENYFFNSYFSHLIVSNSPVKGNIVQFWQNQINNIESFPIQDLTKHHLTLQSLIR